MGKRIVSEKGMNRREKRESIGKPWNLIQQRRRRRSWAQWSGVRVSVQTSILFHPFLSSFLIIYPLLKLHTILFIK